MLAGRRSDFCGVMAGSGEMVSVSASALASSVASSEVIRSGEGGSGTVRAAGGNGARLGGFSKSSSTASRNAIMLECRRGNWKSR